MTNPPSRWRYRAFEVFGVEIEYGIVSLESLEVLPSAEWLLRDGDSQVVGELLRGAVTRSNELAAHVIELKLTEPASRIVDRGPDLQGEIKAMNDQLAGLGARLLPTAMHPWFDPIHDSRLWPYEGSEIYQAFDRIFDCRRHGWTNVQSVHLNLPFADQDEFERLHAASRLALPLLPLLAASSPYVEGQASGMADTRLSFYRHHSDAIAAAGGQTIPEPINSEFDYRQSIYLPIAEALRELDPEGVLREEWVNARGAMPRFDRGSIELRLLDSQEYLTGDLALAQAVASVVRGLFEADASDAAAQNAYATSDLVSLLDRGIVSGSDTWIDCPDFLRLFGVSEQPRSAVGVWGDLLERSVARGYLALDHRSFAALEGVLARGCLARRIQDAVGDSCSRSTLQSVYRELAACLEEDRAFGGRGS